MGLLVNNRIPSPVLCVVERVASVRVVMTSLHLQDWKTKDLAATGGFGGS